MEIFCIVKCKRPRPGSAGQRIGVDAVGIETDQSLRRRADKGCGVGAMAVDQAAWLLHVQAAEDGRRR